MRAKSDEASSVHARDVTEKSSTRDASKGFVTRVVVSGRDVMTYRRSSGGDDGGRGRGRREGHRSGFESSSCGGSVRAARGFKALFLDWIIWVNSIVSHEYYTKSRVAC